jgi:hypothetical protein
VAYGRLSGEELEEHRRVELFLRQSLKGWKNANEPDNLNRNRSKTVMDDMGQLDAPFTLSEGGYADVVSKGRWHSITGPKAKPKRQ